MENQHRKITGYRELTQSEIDKMNAIKELAEKTRTAIEELKDFRDEQFQETKLDSPISEEQIFESFRAIEQARVNLQQGFMWLTRAVAMPDSF